MELMRVRCAASAARLFKLPLTITSKSFHGLDPLSVLFNRLINARLVYLGKFVVR